MFFAPTKFVGYIGNSISNHKPNKMNGIDTNIAISEILKNVPAINKNLETAYMTFCRNQGFIPRLKGKAGAPRIYWETIREFPI